MRDFEQLFVASHMIDSAVEMYRSVKNYEQLIRLISTHQPKQLSRFQLDIDARELRADGNKRAAEKYFIAVRAFVNKK